MTLSQELEDIKKGDGLFVDTDAAAKNRTNIELMRKAEVDARSNSSFRPQPLLPKKKENITQEVITMTINEAPPITRESLPEKSKGQILYEQHAQEKGLKTAWKELSQRGKDSWERKANPDAAKKPENMPEIMPGRDWEKDKEAIIADYKSMKLLDLYKKWHLNSGKWKKLKKEWNVPGKGRYSHGKPIITKEKVFIQVKPSDAVIQRLDYISNHLGAMDLKLKEMDEALGDLLQAGCMEEDMKAAIVAAAIDYYSGTGYTKDTRAKKVLLIVQAIERV